MFLVYEVGNLNLAWMLVDRAKISGDFDVILWSPYGFPQTDQLKARAAEEGSVYINETAPDGSLADIFSLISGYLTQKPERLPKSTMQPLPRVGEVAMELGLDSRSSEDVLRAADRCHRRVGFCEDMLVRLGVDAVAMAEDNTERDSFGWIAAARNRGIPTTIMSYGALAVNEAEHAYSGSAAHQVPDHALGIFRKRFPHWLREGHGYAITRLPYVEALGRIVAGLDRWNPWLVNAADAGLIALESDRMGRAYRAQSFREDRLRVIGHPAMDVLHEKRSSRTLERSKLRDYGIDPARPLILVAMPPDQTGTRPIEFGAYESVLDAFTHTPRMVTGAEIIVSPHPNMTEAHKSYLRDRGIAVADVGAAELIPLCDLFIASVSTTIKWALACAVPVINYDVFGYAYDEFENLPAVQVVHDHKSYSDTLIRWTEAAERMRWEQAASKGASEWGIVDGRAIDRMLLSVFRELASV